MQKTKIKKTEWCENGAAPKVGIFGSQNFLFDCQNLPLFYPFTINCLCISFLSYLWVSDDPSILVTRKNP